jgi:PHD/YefM family antitoxin component YafN of YafNO toxin-antitoxin module
MKSMPLTELHNKTREVLKTADKEPVVISSYRKPAYILDSVDTRNEQICVLKDCVSKLLEVSK